MSVRCLLGHDFGEVQTDRDRRERGHEVIVTVQEYRECERCGETRVISENKEIKRAAPPERSEPSESAAPDDGGSATEPATTASPGTGADRLDDFDDVSADEDDGVILQDEPEEQDPRAWPEGDDRTGAAEDGEADASDDPAPWPEVEGEDEGYAAEPNDDGELEGVEFGTGLTPEAAAADANGADATDDGEMVEATGGADRGGFRRAGPSPSPTGRRRSTTGETEFFCPECQFTTPTADSSLRPGDICPNCRMGYITERER